MQPLTLTLLWLGLILGSLGYLGYLGFRLAKKGIALVRDAEPVLQKAKNLVEAVQVETSFERPEANLLDDVNVHLVERAKLLKSRKLKAEQRQRRLIDNLKNTEESGSGHAKNRWP